MSANKRFHLFCWEGYESGGVEDDYRGAFVSLPDAIAAGGTSEVGCVIEVRDGRLWVVAEHDGFPPKWKMDERLLGSRGN